MPLFKNNFGKMYEGYENKTFTDETGKRVTRMVYTGTRFIQQLDEKQRRLYKVLYVMLFIFGVGFIIASGIPRVPANYALYVIIPQALCVISAIITAFSIATYVGAGKVMDTYVYQRANERLKILAIISGSLGIITAVCSIIATFVGQAAGNILAWLCAVFQLASAACYFIIYTMENRTVYTISD